ncbi:hypothetical protein ACFL27_13735 [candidate division CSSED10-310 bacterium]|uniref:Uncharacterized protein n=1 Tax=candidate division CSSED10-310 bacterium TaxID=2855610 RepID=A0ABV6YYI7_UNCC1
MDEKTITEIISGYPYPIAILYGIIAGMDLREEPRKALEYLLQTGEAIARFLGMIALADLLLLKEQHDIDLPASITAEFKKRFRRPSFGIWLGFARDGFTYLKEQGADMVIPDVKELFYCIGISKFYEKKRVTADFAKGINLSSVQSDFKETDAVILQYDATRYLNLFPLYIYDEDSGDAAEVFFYNGYDKKRLEYIGIDPGGKFFVEDQEPEIDRDLDEEFELLLGGGSKKQDMGNVRYSRELHSEFSHIEFLFG